MNDNQMRADEYLTQIRNASKELSEIILQIEYLRYKASGATGIRYDKDHVQTSPQDMMCEAVTEAVALENKLSNRHKELMEMKDNTVQIISLWNNNSARMIDIYYLNHGSMNDVAEQIGCSSRNAYFIKLKALEEFSKHL